MSARSALEEATNVQSEADLFYVAPPGWLSLVASAEGSLTEATLHAEHSLRRSEETGGAETAVILPAHLTLADIAWERNDLAAADHHLNIARRSVRPLLWETVFVQISGSRLQASRGAIDEARAHLIESGQTYLSGETANPLRAMMCRCALDLALRAGDVEDAVRWATGLGNYSRRPLDPSLALRLARARGAHDLGEHIDAALATADRPVGKRIDSLLAVAEESGRSGDERACRDLVAQATILGEPERFVRRFVDADQCIRSAIRELAGAQRTDGGRAASPFFLGLVASSLEGDLGVERRTPMTQDSLVAPLSDREIEVLEQLATGLSYTEIGQALYATRNTVKSHVQHVYTKLGVADRATAVDQARQLGIV